MLYGKSDIPFERTYIKKKTKIIEVPQTIKIKEMGMLTVRKKQQHSIQKIKHTV